MLVEWDILLTLDFNINFPTHLDILERVIDDKLYDDDFKRRDYMREMCIYLLKMCVYDAEMLNFTMKNLAYSILCYSIQCLFCYIIKNPMTPSATAQKMKKRETDLVIHLTFGRDWNYNVYCSSHQS